jgi:hypothetical protein
MSSWPMIPSAAQELRLATTLTLEDHNQKGRLIFVATRSLSHATDRC